MSWTSRRARAIPQSVFLLMDRAKQEARSAGLGVIDLSLGSSDLSPPAAALQTLAESLEDRTTYQYTLRSATRPFLEAASGWYEHRYGVTFDPDTLKRWGRISAPLPTILIAACPRRCPAQRRSCRVAERSVRSRRTWTSSRRIVQRSASTTLKRAASLMFAAASGRATTSWRRLRSKVLPHLRSGLVTNK